VSTPLQWQVQRRLHDGRCYKNTDDGSNIVNLATYMAKDLQKLIMTMGLPQWRGWAFKFDTYCSSQELV
jgi:hypothetical protein